MAASIIGLQDSLSVLPDDKKLETINEKFTEYLNALVPADAPNGAPAALADDDDQQKAEEAKNIIDSLKNNEIQVLNSELEQSLLDGYNLSEEQIDNIRKYLRVKEALVLQDKASLKLAEQLENEQEMKRLKEAYTKLDAKEQERIKKLMLNQDAKFADLEANEHLKRIKRITHKDYFIYVDPATGDAMAKIFKWDEATFDRLFQENFSAGSKVSIHDFLLRTPKEQRAALASAFKHRIDIIESDAYRLGIRMSNTTEQNFQAILAVESEYSKTGYPRWCNKALLNQMKNMVLSGVKPEQQIEKEQNLVQECKNKAKHKIKSNLAKKLLKEELRLFLTTPEGEGEAARQYNRKNLEELYQLLSQNANETKKTDIKNKLEEMGVAQDKTETVYNNINAHYLKGGVLIDLEEDLTNKLINYYKAKGVVDNLNRGIVDDGDGGILDKVKYQAEKIGHSVKNLFSKKKRDNAIEEFNQAKTDVRSILSLTDNPVLEFDLSAVGTTREKSSELIKGLKAKRKNFTEDINIVTKEALNSLAKQLDEIKAANVFAGNEDADHQLALCQQKLSNLQKLKAQPNPQLGQQNNTLTAEDLDVLQQNLTSVKEQNDAAFSVLQLDAIFNRERKQAVAGERLQNAQQVPLQQVAAPQQAPLPQAVAPQPAQAQLAQEQPAPAQPAPR